MTTPHPAESPGPAPHSPAPVPRPSKRPFALKAINGLLLLRGTLYILGFGLILLDVFAGDQVLTRTELAEGGAVALGMGLLNLALAIGMWQLRPWAWRLTIITAGVLLLNDLWGYFSTDRTLSRTLGLLVNVLIVFYMAQPDVRRLFDAGLPTDAPPDAPETAPPDRP